MRPLLSLVICSLLALPAIAGEIVCPQTHVAPAQVVAYPQPIIAAPLAYHQPLLAPAALAGTVYGYQSQPLAQQLQANPYHVDPAQMLRDAARFADSSQALAQRSLDVYQRIGVDALAIRAESEQLRARAALIEATRPQSPVGQLVAGGSGQAQHLTAGGASICVEPDGSGGFVIRIVPTSPATAPQPPAAADQVEPIDPPAATTDVPEGVHTLAARCASCHTGATAKGGVELFADASTLNAIDGDLAKRILAEALAGTMPPKTDAAGQPLPELTDREVATLRLLLEESDR